MKTIKLNFYGSPGAGKTTLAARVFAYLKEKGSNAEYVSEYAKELVHQGIDVRKLDEEDRIVILGQQFAREKILINKVEYIITDSPMFLTAFYHPHTYAIEIVKRRSEKYKKMGMKELHFWVDLESENFEEFGRSHTQSQSISIAEEMKGFLKYCGLDLHLISGTVDQRLAGVLSILETIKKGKK